MIFCIIFLVFLVLFFVPFLLGGVTKFITNLILTMNKLIINHHPSRSSSCRPSSAGGPLPWQVQRGDGEGRLQPHHQQRRPQDRRRRVGMSGVCKTNYLSYYDSLKGKASKTPMGIWSKWGPNFCRETSCGLKRYHPQPHPLLSGQSI